MSAVVNGREVTTSETEYGVVWDNGEIYPADDREDAEFFAGLWGGTIVSRNWYGTAWQRVNA